MKFRYHDLGIMIMSEDLPFLRISSDFEWNINPSLFYRRQIGRKSWTMLVPKFYNDQIIVCRRIVCRCSHYRQAGPINGVDCVFLNPLPDYADLNKLNSTSLKLLLCNFNKRNQILIIKSYQAIKPMYK